MFPTTRVFSIIPIDIHPRKTGSNFNFGNIDRQQGKDVEVAIGLVKIDQVKPRSIYFNFLSDILGTFANIQGPTLLVEQSNT